MRGSRLVAVLAATTVVVLGAGGTAVADNIQDSITASDAPVSLVAGSATGGTATIRVVGNNSDGTTADPRVQLGHR